MEQHVSVSRESHFQARGYGRLGSGGRREGRGEVGQERLAYVENDKVIRAIEPTKATKQASMLQTVMTRRIWGGAGSQGRCEKESMWRVCVSGWAGSTQPRMGTG